MKKRQPNCVSHSYCESWFSLQTYRTARDTITTAVGANSAKVPRREPERHTRGLLAVQDERAAVQLHHQIRQVAGFSGCSVADAGELTEWLIANVTQETHSR